MDPIRPRRGDRSDRCVFHCSAGQVGGPARLDGQRADLSDPGGTRTWGAIHVRLRDFARLPPTSFVNTALDFVTAAIPLVTGTTFIRIRADALAHLSPSRKVRREPWRYGPVASGCCTRMLVSARLAGVLGRYSKAV
jgi:hypothetical protein